MRFLGLLDLERCERLRELEVERDLLRLEREPERLLERDDRDLERLLYSGFLSLRALYDGDRPRRSTERDRDRRRSRDLVDSREAATGRCDFPFDSCFLSAVSRVLFGEREFPFSLAPGSESSSSPNDVMNFMPPSTGDGERDREPDSALRYWP